MVSQEMKNEIHFSANNQIYKIKFRNPKTWFFIKDGFTNDIIANKSKNYIKKYAMIYCKTIISKLIIYNSLDTIQEVLLFNNGHNIEE